MYSAVPLQLVSVSRHTGEMLSHTRTVQSSEPERRCAPLELKARAVTPFLHRVGAGGGRREGEKDGRRTVEMAHKAGLPPAKSTPTFPARWGEGMVVIQ